MTRNTWNAYTTDIQITNDQIGHWNKVGKYAKIAEAKINELMHAPQASINR